VDLQTREAVVSKIIDEGCDAKTFRLEFAGGEGLDFAPGQCVRVAIPGESSIERLCPITSSPIEKGYLEFTACREPRFFELKGGETLRVTGPDGERFYRDDIKHAVLVCAGAGISHSVR
jgi:NAD(P)H-flavin reductase